MKTKNLYPLLIGALFMCHFATAQNGFIYVHLKHVNEENSPDYTFTLKNSSGTTLNTFKLNDQATADNVPLSGNFLNVYDLGLSHGTGGDGQLWAVAGTAWSAQSPPTSNTGSIYYRNPGSSQWNSTGITAKYIDGAYANQCVYIDGSDNVYFYNNGTATQLYSGGDARDVTANGGTIALSTSSHQILLYSANYTASAAPPGGSWITVSTVAASANMRIDLNLSGSTIAYEVVGTDSVKTVSTTSPYTLTVLPKVGNGKNLFVPQDIAFDDNGVIYSTGKNSAVANDFIYHYSGGAWTEESSSRYSSVITGGVAHSVYSVNMNWLTQPSPYNTIEAIFSRQTDNSGKIFWVDDDRVKSSPTYNGNGIFIPVTPGTYTVTETLPSSAYDLGRYNIYDPGGSSIGNVNTQVVTFVVTAGEVVFGEYVNEKLNPKAIALTCSFQYLQTFDASGSSPAYASPSFGSGTYGTNVEGTAYHYNWQNNGFAGDGYYMVTKNITSSNWYNNIGLTDHTGNGGYFLMVNAAYADDEFYRQRVTNLVPGLSYTISFWTASLSPSAPIKPSVTYGLQDTLGNIVNSASTGTFTSSSWTQYSFTFTATTSRADLFLKNNNTGGNGNDLAIDDISINPILPVIPSSTGSNTECVGGTYTFTNTQSGGQWTVSNAAVATVNVNNGRVRAVGPGTAILTYKYTNQIGCVGSTSDTITVTAPPVVAASAKYATPCIGQPDSLYTTFTTTSTAPYAYTWSASPSSGAGLGGTTTQNTVAVPSAAGSCTYITTVTDALGCSATASVITTVSNNSAPTVSATATITSAACAVPVTLNLTGGVSGSLTPNYSYVWAGPGTIAAPNSGSIGATTYNTTASTSAAGSYILTVTDGNGCVGTATAATEANPLVITAGVYAADECNNTKDSLYSAASNGTAPYTYAWTATTAPGTVTYSPGSTADTTGITLATAGTYKFTAKVTDHNGCTATSPTVQVVYVAAAGVTVSGLNAAATKCQGTTISLTSTPAGSTSYTYLWAGNTAGNGLATTNTQNTSATPTAAGSYTYTVKVTGANGCAVSASTGTQTINTSPTLVALGQNPAFCSGTGTNQLFAIASGGTGTYSSYAWTGALTGGAGSTTLSSSSISNPVATIAGTGGTGSAAVGSTFKYTVTVTDANTCTATASTTDIVVAGNPTISVVTGTASTSCAGSGTTIALSGTFSGGTSPYNYAWTAPTGSTVTSSSGTATTSPITASATAAIAQTYTYGLTIVDANNCQATGSDTASPVTLYTGLTVTASASTAGPICASPATSINLMSSASGGSGSYTYAWAGPGGTITTATSQNPTAVPTTTGTYTVTVNDGAGCTGTGTTATVTVDQATPSISITCGTNSNGINYAQLSENSGTATSWLWTTTSGGRFYGDNTLSSSNDGTTSTQQVTYVNYNGTYTVAITDANGCNGTGSTTITSSSCTSVLATSNLDFTAVKQSNTALLTWSTTSETNNSYFNIERSADGITWQVIGTVKGAGTSTVLTKYSFTDGLPLAGTNYYRLKQVDVNGQYDYSPVSKLVFTGQWLVKLYPNPVQNYLVLEFNNGKEDNAKIVIQSVTGNTVFATEHHLAKGPNRITLTDVQLLANGTYMVVIGTKENTFRSKFVKGGK